MDRRDARAIRTERDRDLNARVEHVWTRENESPTEDDVKLDVLAKSLIPASTVPVISGTAWQTSFGINVKL